MRLLSPPFPLSPSPPLNSNRTSNDGNSFLSPLLLSGDALSAFQAQDASREPSFLQLEAPLRGFSRRAFARSARSKLSLAAELLGRPGPWDRMEGQKRGVDVLSAPDGRREHI